MGIREYPHLPLNLIAKVAKSSAVADEAVGNIRTVRAFAMEDKEKVPFSGWPRTRELKLGYCWLYLIFLSYYFFVILQQALFDEEANEATKLNKKLGLSIGAFQGLSNIALNGIVLGESPKFI